MTILVTIMGSTPGQGWGWMSIALASTEITRVRDLPAADWRRRLRQGCVVLRVGPFLFRVGCTLAELADALHLLYQNYHLCDEADLFVDFDVRIELHRTWRRPGGSRARFVVDGERKFEPFDRKLALPMFQWLLNWCTFTRPNQYLILHSAVVERNGLAALLPGPPGSGKSTLCAALHLRDWRLLSDELAMMRPVPPTANSSLAPTSRLRFSALQLLPAPLPIGLKEQSIPVIQAFEKSAVVGPSTPGTRKGTVAHVQVPASSIDRADETATPRWIVFPFYRPSAPATLKPASKAQTLLRLADDAFNYSLLGEIGFLTLAALIDACDCYNLFYGNLDDAIDTMNNLPAAPAATHPLAV